MDPRVNSAKRWAIRHETLYRYSTPVVFAPHVVRLIPRAESARCTSRSLHVFPNPVARVEFKDAYGNSCLHLEFGPEPSEQLLIDSRISVEVLPPAERSPSTNLPALPWAADPSDALAPFLVCEQSAEVAALAERISREVGHEPLAFFERLSLTLYSEIDRQIRVDGPAQTPAETLTSRRGACRDLTVLFLAVCRRLGVAGRFVSGYQGQEVSPDGKRHLHAWPEVYVPPLGWLGWDPTHGVAVGPGHVALAAAPEQAATMPVEGGFYFNGPAVTSTLTFSITLDPA